MYPAAAGETTLKFAEGETVDFACPGGRLVLEGVTTTLGVATASCVTGARFVVNNARFDVSANCCKLITMELF